MPATLLVVVLLALLAFSFPIFIAILAGTVLSFELLGPGMPGQVLPQRMVEGVNVFALLAVPLFIFAADIIGRGQIGRRLVELMESFVGHLRGGLAIATVLSCAFFGAISGIGAAAVVSIGPIVYPAMRRMGYSQNFTVGLILSASTLAMLIPPGVAMIIYAVQTSNSVAQVFLAGLCAGVVFVLFLSAWAYIYARRTGIATQERVPIPERLRRLKQAGWALGLPAVIFGGIYGGVFTPTEAAGIGAAGALVFAVVRLGWSLPMLREVFVESAATTGMMFTILIGALVFANFVNMTTMPAELIALTDRWAASPLVAIAVICLIYIALGCVLESMSMVLLTVPIFMPLVQHLGFDLIWFGIIVVVVTEISLITPPVGLNVFVLRSTLPDIPTGTVFRGVLPFVAADFVRLTLLVLFPAITLVLTPLVR